MVDLGSGLVHTLVSFRLCGVGVGKPPVEVTGGLRQALTVRRNVPGDDRPATLGVLSDRLRGVLDWPLSRLAARRRQAGQVFRAETLGLGGSTADLGFSGQSAGGLAELPVAASGGRTGGLVDRRVG
jgi:hypothetical protein